jgi:hypothetical protein
MTSVGLLLSAKRLSNCAGSHLLVDESIFSSLFASAGEPDPILDQFVEGGLVQLTLYVPGSQNVVVLP